MSYSVEINNGDGGLVDVSDYVIDIGLVPYIERNRNYELAAEGFSLTLSKKATMTPTYNSNVLVKANGSVFYSGYISEIEDTEDNRSYSIQVDSSIKRLQNYPLTYDELFTTINAEADNQDDFNPSDTTDEPTINFIFLLRALFTHAGLTLTTTGMSARTVGQFTSYSLLFHLDDFLIDGSVLFNINQANASDCWTATPLADDPAQYITIFDFIKNVFGVFGLFIVATAEETYALKHYSDGQNYTFADDELQSYSTKTIPAPNIDASLTWLMNASRANYQGGSAAISQVVAYGSGEARISILNNLVFLYRDIRTVASIVAATDAGGGYATLQYTTSTGFAPENGEIVYITGGNVPQIQGYFSIVNAAAPYFDIYVGTAISGYTGAASARYAGEPLAGYGYWDISDLGGGPEPVGIQHFNNALSKSYTEEKATVHPAEFTIYGVVRNYIDIKNDTSEIIQETIL